MHDEDLIFGPLTFKQFLAAAVGVGLAFFSYSKLPQNQAYFAIVVITIASLTLIVRLRPKRTGSSMEEYLSIKKTQMGTEEYSQLLRKKTALISSQIHERELKGMPPDPELNKALETISSLSKEN